MATVNRTHVQTSFLGGEISPKMLMRIDTEQYQKSVLSMINFHPTLQGSAERTPGTRFLYDPNVINNEGFRIIPYRTPANEKAIVEFKRQEIRVLTGYADVLDTGSTLPVGTTLTTIRKQVVPNYEITGGPEPWTLEPEKYQGAGSGGQTLGLAWGALLGGVIRGVARIWKSGDIPTCTITNTATVDFPTDSVLIDFSIQYLQNWSSTAAEYNCTISVKAGTTELMTAGGVDPLEITGVPGTVSENTFIVNLPTTGWTGDLDIVVQWTAISTAEEPNSAPYFQLNRLGIWADDEVEIINGLVTVPDAGVPYGNPDLDDLHYIQSPYNAPDGALTGPQQQLVVTHPNYPPYQLWFNTDAALVLPGFTDAIPVGYVFSEIEFDFPVAWSANNYPNTCTSFNGRLILAGAQDAPIPGTPVSPATETVWGTVVGNWNAFSDPNSVEAVTASDSIVFNTIYRSPIQWVYGQKNLLIGALEMEYMAHADGIFQPADLGVTMQSTHGSAHIQPIGFGDRVMYPADQGTKIREMRFQNEDNGWVSKDMTIFNPDLTKKGIRRMARMRNPHQMLMVALQTGNIAVLHQDPTVNMFGWSQIDVGGVVRDLMTITNNDGEDILVCAVRRQIGGVKKTYVEAIANWTDNNQWDYVSSGILVIPQATANVIGGLDHLEGQPVQVIADRNYLGTYTVIGGTVTLLDQVGDPLNVSSVVVGLLMPAEIILLPPAATDPGSFKRYRSISLRIRRSSRPIINGVRPDDRSPTRIMDKSERLEDFEDVEVTNFGIDIYATVTIEETIPIRCEVLGMYGELGENHL